MRPEILKQSPNEFDTPEGCAIVEMLNTTMDESVSLARARVPPGVTTAWHHLMGTGERYVIVHGEGLVEVGDEPPTRVSTGDAVLIPAGCRQRITNIGATDLEFLCICTPRFQQASYVEGGNMPPAPEDGATTLVELAKDQLEGKNKAIHAYDQMIWTVRSGFVTLFFVAWGFLFKEMLTISALRNFHLGVIAGLLPISFALAFAAWRVERNYVRRKFRVIASVNNLLEGLNGDSIDAGRVRPELRIAGDTDDTSYTIRGYKVECSAGHRIYAISLVGLIIGLVVLWVVTAVAPLGPAPTSPPPARPARVASVAPC